MDGFPPFLPFTGIYEPSAIQQLPDGRFLVAEDEKDHPFSLVDIGLDGRVACTPLLPPLAGDDAVWKLDDLEALALDPAGRVYALTSHSRSGSGEEKRARDKLVRFRVADGRMVEAGLVRDLKPALAAAHPVLAGAAAVLDVKGLGGLNIEALEWSPDGHLLVGFRSPLLAGRAILARVENPGGLFDAGEAPCVGAELVTLDLAGCGLRGLAWVPSLAGYLLIGGPVARQTVPFQLWFWGGRAGEEPRRVRVGPLEGFAHAEGVTPALIQGRPRIVIVSDDGSRAEGRPASFLLIDPADLQVAP
ncbi:MAG: hypothetical protein AB1899_11965 [Pseudomonadota bacterium]